MYISFDKYVEFGGTLDESEFNKYEIMAESVIDVYTYNNIYRIKNRTEQLNDCLAKAAFHQIEFMILQGGPNNVITENIKSESLGDHSVSYSETKYDGFSIAGVKISPLTCNELDKCGLRCNWIIGRCGL